MTIFFNILTLWLIGIHSQVMNYTPTNLIPIKHFHPPFLQEIDRGEMKIKVERKFLFSPNRFLFTTDLFFSPLRDSEGYQHMERSEGINNHGIDITIFDGVNLYGFRDNDSSKTEQKKDWHSLSRFFRENFFVNLLLQPKEQREVSSDEPLHDTTINGVAYHYFMTRVDSIPVKFGPVTQTNPDGSKQMQTIENFYYINKATNLLSRQEEYVYVSNDTQITKFDLLYVHPLHSDAEFKSICNDTLKKYSALYKFETKDIDKKTSNIDLSTFINKPFPNFELKGLDGKPFDIASLPKQYILFDCSYNGCFPCHQSIPALKRIYEEYKKRGVLVIGINPTDSITAIEYSIRKEKIDYPIYSIKKNDLVKMGIHGYPTFILLDKDKNVYTINSGYSETLYQQLSKSIDELIAK